MYTGRVAAPTIRCPSCGAPAAPGAQTCRYCSSPIHLPGPRSPAPTAHPVRGGVVAAYIATGVMFAGGLSASLIARRGAEVSAGTAGPAAAGGEPGFFSELKLALPGPAGLGAIGTYYVGDKYVLARLSEEGQVWRAAQPLSSNLPTLALDDATVYVADGERLQALALADGAQRWQVGLAAELQWKGNLQVVGGSVVAWQKDKSLQAFDPGTGAVRWTRRTPDIEDVLPALGEQIVVALAEDDDKFVLLDAKGAAGPEHTLRCRAKGNSAWDLTFDDFQRVDPAPAGQGALFFLKSIDNCVVRWDPATGKTVWTRWLKDRVSVSHSDRDRMLVDEAGVFFAGDEAIVAVDLRDGAERDVVRDAESAFRLRFVHEGTLVAVHAPDYDTYKRSLWAFTAADGVQRWQYRLPKVTFDREWGVAPAPGGVVVWSSDPESGAVFTERLDLKTGRSELRKVISEAGPSKIGARFYGAIWDPRRAWVHTSGGVYLQDLASGELAPRP